jgi:hypothetical protein
MTSPTAIGRALPFGFASAVSGAPQTHVAKLEGARPDASVLTSETRASSAVAAAWGDGAVIIPSM